MQPLSHELTIGTVPSRSFGVAFQQSGRFELEQTVALAGLDARTEPPAQLYPVGHLESLEVGDHPGDFFRQRQ